MTSNLVDNGTGNTVIIGENIVINGQINGSHNKINFTGSAHPSSVKIEVNGDYNDIVVRRAFLIKGLTIIVGSRVRAHNTQLEINENFSIEGNSRFFLYTSGNSLKIGRDCMFSNSITIRCGDSPHVIFDKETGDYLDVARGVTIGDHVWVGENSYLLKSAGLASDCIVGACAVVTRRFDTPYCAVGGNPARVVRENVLWARNSGLLERGSKYAKSYDDYHSQFPIALSVPCE